MRNRLSIILAVLLIPSFLVSCKKKDAPKPAEPAAKVEQKQVKEVKPEEVARKTVKPDDVVAPPKRNPFLSYAVIARSVEAARKSRGPLECCELPQFKVLAVIVGPESSNALIQTHDNKKYIVKVGDPLGSHDGKVVSISDRHIVVKEPVRDDMGKVTSSVEMELKMPAEKGR